MTTVPLIPPRAPSDPAGVAEYRPSASEPLPRMRSVGDFIGLPSSRRYVTVQNKFLIALIGAGCWTLFAVIVTLASLGSVADEVSWPIALVLLLVVVWVPSFLSAFACVGLVLDQPPPLRVVHPSHPVTVLLTSYNQPRSVAVSLSSIAAQDYNGPMSVLLVDNGSTDMTLHEARGAARQLGIPLRIVSERRVGLAFARNTGLGCVETPLFVTVDSGTTLHPSTVRLLVARLLSSPNDTAAVVGNALVRNQKSGPLAELRAADYSVAQGATRRAHSLFQGPLVADGTCGVYRTDAVRAVNGWSAVDDDNVILTWRFLERGWRVFHEPHAVAFTNDELSFGSLGRQRARSSWALIDAVREAGVRSLRFPFSRFLTVVDMTGPVADGMFTIGWTIAFLMAFTGHFALIGWYLLFVLPLSIVMAALARRSQREVLEECGLARARYPLDWFSPLLNFHCLQAPAAMLEYVLDFAEDRRSS